MPVGRWMMGVQTQEVEGDARVSRAVRTTAARPFRHRIDKNVAMAVDKRSARLGVLATVSLLLIGLLGARLWFLQGVKADEYQAKVTAAKTREVYVAARTRPHLRRRRPGARRQPAHPHRHRRLVGACKQEEEPPGAVRAPVGSAEDAGRRPDAPLRPLLQRAQAVHEGAAVRLAAAAAAEGGRRRADGQLPARSAARTTRASTWSSSTSGCTRTRRWPSHVVGFMGAINEDNARAATSPRATSATSASASSASSSSMERELHGTWGKRVYEVDAVGQHRARAHRPAGRAGRRLRRPAEHRPRHPAVRRAGAARPSCATGATCPTDLAQADSAPHNPCDLKTNCKTRVYQQDARPTARRPTTPNGCSTRRPPARSW